IERLDDQSFRVNAAEPFTLTFRQFYFPGWTATLDDEPIPISPEPDFGLISMDVPAGEHAVRLRYSGTLVENLAPLVTLAGLGLALWLFVTGKPAPSLQAQKLSPRYAVWVGGGLLTFALLSVLLGWTSSGWFPFASPLDAPRGMQ